MSGRGKGRAAGARKRKLDAEYEWAEGEDVASVAYSTADVNEAQLAIVPLGKLESYIFKAITLMSKDDLKYTLAINCADADAGNLFQYIWSKHVREIEEDEDEEDEGEGDEGEGGEGEGDEEVSEDGKCEVLNSVSQWASSVGGFEVWLKTPPCAVTIRARVSIFDDC